MKNRIIEYRVLSSISNQDLAESVTSLFRDKKQRWEPLGKLEVHFAALIQDAKSNKVALSLYTQVMVRYEEEENKDER